VSSSAGKPSPWRNAPILAVLLVAVSLAYSNHFHNDFHFDDFHTITNNPWIRSLHNIPRFFTDAETSSTLPSNRAWRPLVTTSLAIDYMLGDGPKPFWFHLSTFVWFLTQIVLTFLLFRLIFDLAQPHDWNRPVAALAAAWYGLHPANAETVNYIIQRADLYSTLGVIAGLYLYAARPVWRKYGFYLIPLVLALLCKPPALVFPFILFAYVFLFEHDCRRDRIGAAIRASIPSLIVTTAILALSAAMTPRTFVPGATSATAYRITQPYVALHYCLEFFLPFWLSADTDQQPFQSILDANALAGFVFVAALVIAAFRLARRREWRPIAFGLFWFILAMLPTSLFPLAEVENDHRMFFPFVGLAMSVTWGLALVLRRRRTADSPRQRAVIAAVATCVVIAYGWGVWRRNQVWHTEESLWLDVTRKSPRNGRGLMNYGLTQMNKGDYATALEYYNRALVYTPNYPTLEINIGIAYGQLGEARDAEEHFARAISLAPSDAQSHFYYGRWLFAKGRTNEAAEQLRMAVAQNPAWLDPSYVLMQLYATEHSWSSLNALATQVLRIAPNDQAALGYLNSAQTAKDDVTVAEQTVREHPTPENWLQLSLLYYRAGRYRESLAAADHSAKLRPDYAEAWNNIAAANAAMSLWDPAIDAARKAVQLKPDFQLAKNNLAWALSQKAKRAEK